MCSRMRYIAVTMNLNILTVDDLEKFKKELLIEIRHIIEPQINQSEWLKSKEVCEMLKISASTLQNLRISGQIKYKKIMGTLYYNSKEIIEMLS